jgi:hypothetical protein
MGKTGQKVDLQLRKETLLQELREVRSSILEISASFSQEEAEQVFVGSWSLLDILAHLVGWDYTNIEASREILRGEMPAFYDKYDKDWKSYNAGLVSEYKRGSLDAMLASVTKSHSDLLRFIGDLPSEQIFKDHGVRRGRYKVIISRLMEADIMDVNEHLRQIRAFVREG